MAGKSGSGGSFPLVCWLSLEVQSQAHSSIQMERAEDTELSDEEVAEEEEAMADTALNYKQTTF